MANHSKATTTMLLRRGDGVQIPETEPRVRRTGRQINQVAFVEPEINLVSIPCGFNVEGRLVLVDAKRAMIAHHVGGRHCTVDIPALDDDGRGQIKVGNIGLFANIVGIDQRERVVETAELDVELSRFFVEGELDQSVGIGHAEDALEAREINADPAATCLVGLKGARSEREIDHTNVRGVDGADRQRWRSHRRGRGRCPFRHTYWYP